MRPVAQPAHLVLLLPVGPIHHSATGKRRAETGRRDQNRSCGSRSWPRWIVQRSDADHGDSCGRRERPERGDLALVGMFKARSNLLSYSKLMNSSFFFFWGGQVKVN